MSTALVEFPLSTVNGESQQTAVVGGGLLGMQIASHLRQAGHAVTLFEAAPHLGGMADAWKLADIDGQIGFTWDRHYHVILMSDIRTRQLLQELGIENKLVWTETKTGFYTDGKLTSMSNTVEFLKFPPLRLIDKLRLGGTIFYASKIKNWQRLEKIHVVDWLRKWSGSRTTDQIWLPLLRAKLGENYQYASAAFIWAIIARMYAARRTGLKKEMFGYVRGGYGHILDCFSQRLEQENITVKTGSQISSIQPTGQPTGNEQLTIQLQNGSSEQFNNVVVTTPGPITSKICPSLNEQERSQLNALRYQGIVCASLVLKKALGPYYVTNITDRWVPFTAVIEMTALVKPQAEFGGKHLVYLPKYVDPADPLFEKSDAEIRESFVSALEKMYSHFQRSDVIDFKLSRVRNVLAIPTVNYSKNLPPMKTGTPGLYLANSAHIVNGTLNVNETLALADKAAEVIKAEIVKVQTSAKA